MKKIILAGINARYTHSCLALYCLRSAVRDLDVSIIIREFSINQKAVEIAGWLAAEDADVIALSVYIWNSELVRKLIPALHDKCGDTLLVLGGPEVSFNPGSWLEAFPCIHCIITGHGEEGFRKLVKNSFMADGKIISVPNTPFTELPGPYTEEDLTGLRNRYIYYESTRGCPLKCTYCLSSRSDQKMEMKSMDNVKRELDLILQDGPPLVKFVDRTFNAAGKHSRAIWLYLLENYNSGPTTFHFEIHPLYLDEEDFEILSRCPKGLFQFEIGVQSTNPETLTAVKRSGEWIREKTTLARLIGLGTIQIHLDLIAGLPFEDMQSIARSFNDVYDLRPDHLQLGFLKILPGTDMMGSAGRYGMAYSPRAPYQVMETAWLGRNELRLLEGMAHLVDRLYNTRRFDATLSLLAGRHESSFDLYRELSSFLDETTGQLTRRWESCAQLLLKYIASRFSGEKSFFLDAVRWDWCAVSRSPYYPGLIKPEGLSKMKKKGFSFFESLAEGGTLTREGTRYDLSDLKRSLFFEPESDDFRVNQMKGNTAALFLPDKKIVMYTA